MALAGSMAANAQQMEAKQNVIDCGQILYGRPIDVTFDITNKTNRTITIDEVRTSCGCTTASYPTSAIGGGKSFKLTASYDARQMGHFEKQVGVYANSSREPLILTIRGVVVDEVVDFAGDYPITIGTLRADKQDIEFDDVNRGDRPSQKIHIFNPTSKTIEPQVMHLPNYLKAQVSPSTIAPNRSGVITLSLDSRLLREYGLSQTSVFLGAYPGDKVAGEKEITVSAVLLPDFRNITDQTREYAPRMVLSSKYLDLGSFEGKKKKKGEITITNNGRTNLDIQSLQMYSLGLEISLGSKTIAPGASTKLKITAIASQMKKLKAKPRVLMITNDPENAKVILTVNAE